MDAAHGRGCVRGYRLHRMRLADAGLAEMAKAVDTLIVIPNQNLFRRATERTSLADSFKMADEARRPLRSRRHR
jgi:cell division GTPase FtsZ